MQAIQHISMDFTVHGITPKIYGKQDDSGSMRAVAISLYSGGAAYLLTKNTGFMLRYKTAAGAIGLYDVLPDGSSAFSVDGNTVTVTLVDQIFAMPGNVECELRVIEPETVVYSGDTATQTSGMISTWTWIVEVERSNVGDATIPSDYINVLSGYAATAVQAAAEAKESASSIDTASLMKLADYDASSVVKAAGGIADFVLSKTIGPETQNTAIVEAVNSTSVLTWGNANVRRIGSILFVFVSASVSYPQGVLSNNYVTTLRIKGLPILDNFAFGNAQYTLTQDGSSITGDTVIGTPGTHPGNTFFEFSVSDDAPGQTAGATSTVLANLILSVRS